jgi:hypothetical protein
MTFFARNHVAPGALSADEEVTLRRIAYGESEVRCLRASDIARLHALKLIEDSKDGPRLTGQGKVRFGALPKPSAQLGSQPFDDLLAQMRKLLVETHRPAAQEAPQPPLATKPDRGRR